MPRSICEKVVSHDVVHEPFMSKIMKTQLVMFAHEHDDQAFPP